MPRKQIPVPSDFARPKPGSYAGKKSAEQKRTHGGKPFRARPDAARSTDKPPRKNGPAPHPSRQTSAPKKPSGPREEEAKMPLNKYIAHGGICSRRDAIPIIKEGRVQVNGQVEKEPGYKVQPGDIILLDQKRIQQVEQLEYYLLNKPKNFITTADDPEGRRTVLDLFRHATQARIFPVGRLDRNTTGLLLLTNDGELAQKLAHPKNKIRKIYQAGLDRPLQKNHLEAIAQGLILEDGKAEVDEIAFVDPDNKKLIGIEIHSGRNRIVRRLFEHFGYEVKTLDRVVYAGLTKKNLPRGKFRKLEPHEVVYLKHFR